MNKNVTIYIFALEQHIELERGIQHRLSDDNNFLKAFFDIKDKLNEVRDLIDDDITIAQVNKLLKIDLLKFIEICEKYNGDKSLIRNNINKQN